MLSRILCILFGHDTKGGGAGLLIQSGGRTELRAVACERCGEIWVRIVPKGIDERESA